MCLIQAKKIHPKFFPLLKRDSRLFFTVLRERLQNRLYDYHSYTSSSLNKRRLRGKYLLTITFEGLLQIFFFVGTGRPHQVASELN